MDTDQMQSMEQPVVPPVTPQPSMAPQPIAPQQPMQPEPKQSSSAWNKMLLFLLAFIILVVIAGGAYYLGMQRSASVYTAATPTVAMPTAVPSVMPTASSASAQLVKAGGVLNLKAYTATVPAGWQVDHVVKTDSDQLTITKDGYTINIWQVAGGGGACSYPDHKLTMGIIHGDYTTFVQLTDQDGMVYRRGSDGAIANNTGMHYSVCELSQGNFSELTPFGVIFYTTPTNPTDMMLAKMDEVVSSLKAQ